MKAQMQIITRKNEERITMVLPQGQEIIVTLVESLEGSARIGIEAPIEIYIGAANSAVSPSGLCVPATAGFSRLIK